jgi:hypothetical protein
MEKRTVQKTRFEELESLQRVCMNGVIQQLLHHCPGYDSIISHPQPVNHVWE